MSTIIYDELLQLKGQELYDRKIKYTLSDSVNLQEYIFETLPTSQQRTLVEHFSKNRLTKSFYHLLIDIDDTIYPGKSFGLDNSYKKGEIYPLLLLFLHMFCTKNTTSNFVTLLTARPKIMKKYVVKKFRQLLNLNVDVLPGKLSHLTEGVKDFLTTKIVKIVDKRKGDYSQYTQMGTNKYNNYLQYSQMFPEFQFIFIGDSGQGDILTSQLMLKSPYNNTLICFIHEVIISKRTIMKKKESNYKLSLYKTMNKQNSRIIFFYTYAKVFRELFRLNIFDSSNYSTFVKKSKEEMTSLDKDKFNSDFMYNFIVANISKYI